MIEIIGFLAASLTTVSFLPQALRVIRTQSTSDLSLLMYTLFIIGVSLWLVYGILLDNLVIIVANAITLVLSGTVYYVIIKNTFFVGSKDKTN